jgi:hypothetical protein
MIAPEWHGSSDPNEPRGTAIFYKGDAVLETVVSLGSFDEFMSLIGLMNHQAKNAGKNERALLKMKIDKVLDDNC